MIRLTPQQVSDKIEFITDYMGASYTHPFSKINQNSQSKDLSLYWPRTPGYPPSYP